MEPTTTSNNASEWLEFEDFRYVFGRDLNQFGEPEVVDVSETRRAEIIKPEEGKSVIGRAYSDVFSEDGSRYAIFEVESRFVAIDTGLSLRRSKITSYQIRSVVLDGADRRLAWEVLQKDDLGAWVPIPGQHLRTRTAPAELWLREMSQPLLQLRDRERSLMEERRGLLDRRRELVEVAHSAPPSQSSSSLSRPEERSGPSVRTVTNRELVQSGPTSIPSSLGQRLWSRLALVWGSHPEQHATRSNLQGQPETVKRKEANVACHGVGSPSNSREIEARLKAIDRTLTQVGRELEVANGLVQHLEQRRGTSVTLQESAIEGRKSEVVPVLPPRGKVSMTPSVGRRMRP